MAMAEPEDSSRITTRSLSILHKIPLEIRDQIYCEAFKVAGSMVITNKFWRQTTNDKDDGPTQDIIDASSQDRFLYGRELGRPYHHWHFRNLRSSTRSWTLQSLASASRFLRHDVLTSIYGIHAFIYHMHMPLSKFYAVGYATRSLVVHVRLGLQHFNELSGWKWPEPFKTEPNDIIVVACFCIHFGSDDGWANGSTASEKWFGDRAPIEEQKSWEVIKTLMGISEGLQQQNGQIGSDLATEKARKTISSFGNHYESFQPLVAHLEGLESPGEESGGMGNQGMFWTAVQYPMQWWALEKHEHWLKRSKSRSTRAS